MSAAAAPANQRLALTVAPWLTAAYLVFELAFNARLLDIAGGLPDLDDLNGIDFWGRVLSGVGASLVLWRLISQRRGHYSFSILLAVALIAGTAVFFGQRELVQYVVRSRTTTELRQAAQVVLASRATLQGEVTIQGLELKPSEYGSPAGKAFFAVLPLMASVTPYMLSRIDHEVERIVNASLRAEVGDPVSIYKAHYLPIANGVRALYNQHYITASNRLMQIRASTGTADQDWERYRSELGQLHISATNPPPDVRAQVLARLRQSGVPVSDDFRLDDRAAFQAAHPRTRAELEFRRRVNDTLGQASTLDVGLDVIQFTQHADIQAYARTLLTRRFTGIALPAGVVDLNAGSAQFSAQFYEPWVRREVTRRVTALTASIERYAPGEIHHESGQRAMKVAVVPAVALGFSLFFGLLNLISLLSDRIRSPAWARRSFKLGLVAAVLVGPFLVSNNVTRSPAYQSLEPAMAARSTAGALALRWVVQAEPVFYPVTNRVRKLLLGIEFRDAPRSAR